MKVCERADSEPRRHGAGAVSADAVGDNRGKRVLIEPARDIGAGETGKKRLLVSTKPEHEIVILVALERTRVRAGSELRANARRATPSSFVCMSFQPMRRPAQSPREGARHGLSPAGDPEQIWGAVSLSVCEHPALACLRAEQGRKAPSGRATSSSRAGRNADLAPASAQSVLARQLLTSMFLSAA
jgi:hypothetical protein